MAWMYGQLKKLSWQLWDFVVFAAAAAAAAKFVLATLKKLYGQLFGLCHFREVVLATLRNKKKKKKA